MIVMEGWTRPPLSEAAIVAREYVLFLNVKLYRRWGEGIFRLHGSRARILTGYQRTARDFIRPIAKPAPIAENLFAGLKEIRDQESGKTRPRRRRMATRLEVVGIHKASEDA